MATKTDRILSYLPGTFRALPRPTALYSVVDTFGSELLKAENSLAALMLAHWVDHADKGAEVISDLACIAALYGLTPQSGNNQSQSSASSTDGPPCPPLLYTDEGVEEFREHLKRYVRTFIEGTVTVQGILRITAEALGLHIADEYAQMDTWWTRSTPDLLTTELRGDDAAAQIFGSPTATAIGTSAQPARIVGKVDLSNAIDLRGASTLRLKVDGAAAVDVDCIQGGNASAMQLSDIVNAINTQLKPLTIASNNGRNLLLTSPTVGASSQLEIQEIDGDAAPLLLGLLPFTYHGSAAIRASVTSPFDLHAGINLGENHYLRLQIDNIHLAEVDLPTPAATLDDLKNAINAALGIDVTSHDGHFLTLTSPSDGIDGSIVLIPSAAQDARASLFGTFNTFTGGTASSAAVVISTQDLSNGVDLSKQDRIRIQLDKQPPVTIDCTGNDPAHTLLSEIIAIINTKLGSATASHNGHFIRLVSPTSGPDSTIVFQSLPDEEDATALLFDIVPRTFHGAAATNARLIGTTNLSGGVDLSAMHTVQVALNGSSPDEIDLRKSAKKFRTVTLDEMKNAMNSELGDGIATHDGQHLILVSPTTGNASRIDIAPLVTTTLQRFVTQAYVIDEAAFAIFGTVTQQSKGIAATHAQVIGTVDLSRGVDLREVPFLRIGLDGQPPQEIDCTAHSKRPRAATLDEVVQSINDVLGPDSASSDGHHLILNSHIFGEGSRILFELPRSADALTILLGQEPSSFNGDNATGVSFVGTTDLSAGVDLSTTQQIKIAIDGAAAKEINCVGFNPAKTSLQEIVITINIAFSATGTAIASQDGTHIIITSPTTGTGSSIEFSVPSQPDATQAIFGIAAPLHYHGADATPARVVGTRDLRGTIDMHLAHFIRIALDGQLGVDINCTANASDPTAMTAGQIVKAINDVLGPGRATISGTQLILTTATTGTAARLELQPYTVGDARTQLLGGVPVETLGMKATPATLLSNIDLLNPVNLDGQGTLRLAIDGDYPLDISVAGATPAQTTLNEIVSQINTVVPGLASAENDHLRLTSPTAGENSQLALSPLRTLELIEYPVQQRDETPLSVHHGETWFEVNDSGVDADLTIDLSAPQGATWPSLVNLTNGTRLCLMINPRSDELVQVSRDPLTGIRATLTASDGTQTVVPGTQIAAGPTGAQAQLPFTSEESLHGGEGENSAALQLNNPLAPAIIVLSAQQPGPAGNSIIVNVTTAALSSANGSATPTVANGQLASLKGCVRKETTGYRLAQTTDVAGATLAQLRASHGISLETYLDQVVIVSGPLHEGTDAPIMIVNRIADLFDVTLQGLPAGKSEGDPLQEQYLAVTIGNGTGPDVPEALPWQIFTRPSQLVQASEFDKGSVLKLPQRESKWLYLDGGGSRFETARFNREPHSDPDTRKGSRFAGRGQERALFNISRFNLSPKAKDTTVFARDKTIADPPVDLQFHWLRHQLGAFTVNLPDDLSERFGSRFNQARFGMANAAPETYPNVVTEPGDDPDYIGTRLKTSTLVEIESVSTVPIGWSTMRIPFYHPRSRTLSGGSDSQPASLYLQEVGVPGFVRLKAKTVGAWGNAIAITVRKGSQGPAYFDVTISYAGVRLENARQVVLGGKELPLSGDALLQPGPIGILQAKAAGIQADVTRKRT